MVFSSLFFLYAFLPVFLALYYATPTRWRNVTALLGSLVFYAWGEPVFIGVLVVFSLFIYGLGLWLDRLRQRQLASARWVLTLGVAANLALLGYCKYANFFVTELNGVLGWLHHGSLAWTKIALPLGVSFFIFQKISYLVDIYRGEARPARHLIDFLLYVMLFPQLIAGPIVRYRDIDQQIRHREHTVDRFLSGVWRFLLGLGRKVLIANQLGAVADTVFAQQFDTLPLPYAWVGILCYAFQIYFDFAGYSDMAIGLARMMGFEFIENFEHPYTSRSITEFWRRWHRSLSSFMRDYLYIPLGGNRVAPWRARLNLWFVFLASGFWHGASWSFVAWGAYHGTWLSLEKILGLKRLGRIPAVLGVALTFLLVLVGWVFFRADNLAHALVYLGRMVAFDSWDQVYARTDLLWPDVISHRTWGALAVAAVASFVPDTLWRHWGWEASLAARPGGAVLRVAIGAAGLLFATAALCNQSYNPFIYFRF